MVALAIIILIAAVLYQPYWTRTRLGCPKSTCVNNMKECALAVQLYWGDYDSHLPSSALVSHSKTWNKRDFLRFATKAGKLPPGRARTTWAQICYDKMKNKDIMFCNDDPVDQSNPNARCSYWWKTAIDKAWYGIGCKRPCRLESDFVYNSDQVIFYEHQPFHSTGQGGLVNGAQINVAFLDTHVKTVTLINATSGDPVNCAGNSDGEPMYFSFDNNRPRGKHNPPPPNVPARYIDPRRYSDALLGQ